MNQSLFETRKNERGGARAKFIIAITIFAIVIYAGYMYVPVALDSYYFKDAMQNKVDMAAAQGKDAEWARDQLVKSLAENHIPADAVITPTQQDNRIQMRVQFTRPISFPGYTYNYEFDQTVQSSTFLMVR